MIREMVFQYLREQWRRREARATLVFLLVIGGGIGAVGGFLVSSWYFNGLLETKKALLEQKDAQLARYRVALGIDKASSGALIELTNVELKAKASTTSAKLRNLYQSFERQGRQIQELKNGGAIGEKEAVVRSDALMRQVSEEYERTVRADATNVDNELRRRLGPKAVASIVGVPPSVFSASDGAPVGILGLVPGGMSAAFLGVLANSIDQMAQLLPSG